MSDSNWAEKIEMLTKELENLKNSIKETSTVTENLGTPVLVTTKHRGVFFGYAKDTTGGTIKLLRCRNVFYWSREMKGFQGLAVFGPDKNCKIGQPTTTELRDITSVTVVENSALENWEKSQFGA